jgi:hypothetical protein
MPLLVCALVVPATLEAQPPVAAITTGTLTVSSTSTRPVLTVADVNISSVFDDGAFEPEECRPCIAGAPIGVGGRITGVGKGNQFYEADFTFTGASLRVPANGLADLELSAPFTFRGKVVVAPRRNAGPDEKDPAIELDGGGTVTINLTSSIDPDSGNRLYFFQAVTYQFSPRQR